MPQPLSVEEERKRRKKLPSPIPPLPEATEPGGSLLRKAIPFIPGPTGLPALTESPSVRKLFLRPLVTPEMVEKLPEEVQWIGRAGRELTSPAQIALMAATAGFGPAAAAVIRGGTGVLGVARGLLAGAAAPVLAKAPFAPRLAAEAGINLAATLGAQEAARRIPETAPWPVRVGLPLAAGLAGAGGVLAAGRVLPPLARAVGREIITTPAVRKPLLKVAMPLKVATPEGEVFKTISKARYKIIRDEATAQAYPILSGPGTPEEKLATVYAMRDEMMADKSLRAQAAFPRGKKARKGAVASQSFRRYPEKELDALIDYWDRLGQDIESMTPEARAEVLKPTLTQEQVNQYIAARPGLFGGPQAPVIGKQIARPMPPPPPAEDLLRKPTQIDMLGEYGGGGAAGPPGQRLIEPEPLLARAARQAELARGQGEMMPPAAGAPRAVVPPAPAAAKEPWQMTLKEFSQARAEGLRRTGGVGQVDMRSDVALRRVYVEKALSEGKAVPPEVLADYPDLVAKAPPAAKPPSPIAVEGAQTGPARYRQHLQDRIGELDGLGATDEAYSHVVDLRYTRFKRKATETWRDFAVRVAGSKVPKPPGPIVSPVPTAAEVPLAPAPAVKAAEVTPPRAAEPPVPAVAEAAQAPVGPTRAEIPPSAAAPPPVKPPTEPPVRGGPPEPPEDALKRLATYIHSPESLKLSDLTIQMRKAEAGQRITRFASRVEELLAQGKKTQEAIDQATKETMGGKFERPISALTESMAKEFEEAGFARIHAVLKDEPWEEISTAGALRNALEGKGIPRIVGVEGGSAYTRLSRVFPPEVMEVLGKGKPLAQVFEDARLSGPGREWQPHEIPGPTWERAEQGLFPGVFPSKGSLGRLSQEEVRQRWLASFPEGQPYEIPGQPWERAEQLGLAPKPPPMEPRPRLTPQEMERQKQLLEGYLVGQMPTPRGVPEPLILPTLEKETRQALIPLVPSSHREVILRVAKEAGLNVMDVLNFTRANKSSFDLSFWRQMAMLAPANKRAFWRANLRGLKAAKSAEFAKAFDDSIRADLRYYTWYERLGLDFLRPLEQKGLPAYKRTEEFLIMGGERPLQKLAGKLPHLRISQRAFVTSTNSMTWDIFKGYVDDMLAQNAKIAAGKKVLKPGEVFDVEGNIKALGTMLEDMSGRAQLGKPLQGLSGPLNAGLFAVRFSLGRFLTPRHLLSANPMVRREAWKNVLAFVGTITAVEMLGEGLGLWSVGKDPRGPHFRKIRIGNTWYDPWGGFLQYAVLTARLMSRQRVDELTGRRTPANPIDTLTWFVRGKGAPGASLLADFATGTTFLGEKTNIRDLRQWVNRIAPMSLEDFYDVAEEEGAWGIAMGIPGIVGIGMATYGLRENWSKELAPYYAIPANELEVKAKKLPLTRNNYRKRNPGVDAKLFIAGDVESLRTMTAHYQVVQLMRQLKVRPQDVEGLQEKEYESKERKALRLWILRALGQSPRPPLPGTRGGSPPVPSWDYQYR